MTAFLVLSKGSHIPNVAAASDTSVISQMTILIVCFRPMYG